MFIAGLFIGSMVGSAIGVVTMCLFQINKDSWKE